MDLTCENKAAILLKRYVRQKIIGHTNNENDVNGNVDIYKYIPSFHFLFILEVI